MFSIAHSLLLRLPPETAHHLGLALLKFYQWIRFRLIGKKIEGRILIRVSPQHSFYFGSRLGLGAGFDKQAEVYAGLLSLGFGFVEVGTVTPRPQPGNPKPRIWRVAPRALVNHLGFNSVGIDRFSENFRKFRAEVARPVFANIGKNKDTPEDLAYQDYALLFSQLEELADGFVVNISSPNTPGLVNLQSQQFLASLFPHFPKSRPVLIKLSPDLDVASLKSIAEFIRDESRVAGLVLTNTSRELASSLKYSEVGGLSGPPLYERSLERVTIARQVLGPGKTLIGVGGISSAEEAEEMRRAGADLIEIYTGFVYRGVSLVREINARLKN